MTCTILKMDAFFMWDQAIAQKGLTKLEGGLEAKGCQLTMHGI